MRLKWGVDRSQFLDLLPEIVIQLPNTLFKKVPRHITLAPGRSPRGDGVVQHQIPRAVILARAAPLLMLRIWPSTAADTQARQVHTWAPTDSRDVMKESHSFARLVAVNLESFSPDGFGGPHAPPALSFFKNCAGTLKFLCFTSCRTHAFGL